MSRVKLPKTALKRWLDATKPPKDSHHRGFNRREAKIDKLAIEKGYEVLKAGWPDRLLYKEKEGKAVFLEIKSKTDELNAAQERMAEVLKKLGLNWQIVYVD